MAVTVKRKKLELKKAQTILATSPDGMGADAQTSVVMPMPFAPQQKAPSYVVYGILGILAFLMFSGLLFIQWMEWDEYNSQPGLNFPLLTPEAFAETATAPAEAAAPDAAGEADVVEKAPQEASVPAAEKPVKGEDAGVQAEVEDAGDFPQ